MRLVASVPSSAQHLPLPQHPVEAAGLPPIPNTPKPPSPSAPIVDLVHERLLSSDIGHFFEYSTNVLSLLGFDDTASLFVSVVEPLDAVPEDAAHIRLSWLAAQRTQCSTSIVDGIARPSRELLRWKRGRW